MIFIELSAENNWQLHNHFMAYTSKEDPPHENEKFHFQVRCNQIERAH